MKLRQKLTFILALIAAAVLVSAPAQADILFTRQTTYSDPVSLGIIVGDGEPFSPLQSNMGGNTGNRIFPFRDAEGNLRIALTFYTGVGQSANDTIDIFNPGARANWGVPANWNTPIKQFTCSTKNVRALATIGSYMYTTGYDKAVVSRVVMTGDSYVENKVWQHPEITGKHGEGLFAYNGYIYAIITDTTGDPMKPTVAYSPNQIWKFDKDLNVIASAEMQGRNMDGQQGGIYTRVGNKLYVCSFGGYQETGGGYNGNTTIEVCDLDTLECTVLATGKEIQEKQDPDWHYMFSGLAFVNSKVYIHGTTWTAPEGQEGSHEMVVYETTEERLLAGDIGERMPGASFVGDYGVQMGLTYDPETGYLWAREGDSIQRLNPDGTWTEFDQNALKGSLTDAAPIYAPSSSGEGAVIESSVLIDQNDIFVETADENTEIIIVDTNANIPSALAQAVTDGAYSYIVENGSEWGELTPLGTIEARLDATNARLRALAYARAAEGEGENTGEPAEGEITGDSASFAVENFGYAPAEGASLYVLARKAAGMGSTYYRFPASLSEDGVLTFTVSPLSDFFRGEETNTLVIAETQPVEIPEEPAPWGGDGSGTSGCSTGAGALALLLAPLARAAWKRTGKR